MPHPQTPPAAWMLRRAALPLDRPLVMGVVNVTPDSFSDGGQFFSADTAIAHGVRLVEEGADVLDVGGESTRPQGAREVSAAEERRRVLPVIGGLRERLPDAVISVDTVKSDVAAAALAEGADIVNDVSGFRLDGTMAAVCARTEAGVILMHSRGGVSDMATYAHASYGPDVMADVIAELEPRAEYALESGVARERIALDPGLGFGKRTEHSVAALASLSRLAALGYPVAVGASRKRFVGELSGAPDPADRLPGTIAANVMALAGG
ncbi:MAG: dihydropteroate synthase, partial [Gemmatimonadaceae bacterium]